MNLGGCATTDLPTGGTVGKLQKYYIWTGQYVPRHVGAPTLWRHVKVYTKEEILAIQGQIKPPEKKNKALEKLLDYFDDNREYPKDDE